MPNDFFSLCRRGNVNKVDTYNCCIETCTSNSTQPYACYSMCAQLFPIIKDRCALENECWRDGFYNKKCLEAKAPQIQKCCVDRCNASQANLYSYTKLDCERYCSEYMLQ
jgi:hypothetical protein